MNKKDFVIVALATFCLTSTLFMILPSRSAERDPWADVSGPTVGEPDGTINMRDIAYEVAHFNQDVSNMTRNVNVTNWPTYDIQHSLVNVSGFSVSTNFTCGGYSRLSVIVIPKAVSNGTWTVTFALYEVRWGKLGMAYDGPFPTDWQNCVYNFTIFANSGSLGWSHLGPTFMTETKAESCELWWVVSYGSLPEDCWVTFDAVGYLRNE